MEIYRFARNDNLQNLDTYVGKQKYFNFSKNTISLRNSIFYFSKILKNFCVPT